MSSPLPPPSSLACKRLSVCTVAAVILQAIGVSVFVLGFFPVKPALSGVSGPESFRSPACDSGEASDAIALPPHQLKSLYQNLSELPPPFDRLVFMVVDGLPAEFLLGKDNQPPSKALVDAMPYTQSLLANGGAIGYHAKAAPPTVTMPRLKAMVSGAIGGFLDVAFNFNTQALLDDNLLGQFLRVGLKMVMLGDDTWLKLFPGLFTRSDGVHSFFVKDIVQVDHNVSRHLAEELYKDDWNILAKLIAASLTLFQILHYLGLDHVGHIGGRNSIFVAPKLTEMDEVVKKIHLSTMLPQDNDQGRTLLMVVSDHGMTENGNHGGSSFEETDSLALFIGSRSDLFSHTLATNNEAYQVDITPTLALLLGVPIPKNNIGVLIEATLNFFTDDQKLRALELNSFQLLRLLQAQLPGSSCESLMCDGLSYVKGSTISECNITMDEMFCCLYKNAAFLHTSLKSKLVSRDKVTSDDYARTTAAYYIFLRRASEWLSHRATNKPIHLLALGVGAMLLSGLLLLNLLFRLCREVFKGEGEGSADEIHTNIQCWHVDDAFIFIIIFIAVISMGSSSMVEEEQYIWHFGTSTLFLVFFRKMIQALPAEAAQSYFSMKKEQTKRSCFQMYSIVLLLISGRILRGWHQGGVNWTHLPDISKWLEQSGSENIKLMRLLSGILLMCLSLIYLFSSSLKRVLVFGMGFSFFIPGMLVLKHIINYHDLSLVTSNYGATLMAQIIYLSLGISTLGTVVVLPWIVPAPGTHNTSLIVGLRDAAQVIGWAYVFCWCVLQLLLQQPLNSMPILLLFLQILANLLYYSNSGLVHKQWVEVAALYCLGMAGHFGLGNSNTLATIDVAGAFIGISSHSTFLSGILMFTITYASPMLVLLSMVMYIAMDTRHHRLIPQNADLGYLLKVMIGVPCLVPLGLNSVLLNAYTIVLLLMQNHLFIWSVFSPKFLYVCAMTLCVSIGVLIVAVTMLYCCFVLVVRKKS